MTVEKPGNFREFFLILCGHPKNGHNFCQMTAVSPVGYGPCGLQMQVKIYSTRPGQVLGGRHKGGQGRTKELTEKLSSRRP